MYDYRLTQIEELENKIRETRLLLDDPEMAELAGLELADLEAQKKEIEDSMQSSSESTGDNLDERNVILEVKGAAGGDEANIFASELLRMYIRYAERNGLKTESI